MLIKSVPQPTPEEGNDLYPLPLDYYELGEDGQRAARLNAVCCQYTPQQVVSAWAFMRKYYLLDVPEMGWYQPPIYASPSCHYRFIRDMATYARNVYVFPRAFAKTTLHKEFSLLMLMTRPFYSILLIKSQEEYAAQDMEALRTQLKRNPRINDDFSSVIGEGFCPKRGDLPWGSVRFHTTIGSKMLGRSIMANLLGQRPNVWIADDCEFDDTMRISPALLTENLRRCLKNVLVPMLDPGKTGLMLGTLLSRKTLLYDMACSSITEDPGLAYWNRVFLPAKMDDELIWPEKFSQASLDQKLEELGPEAFAAQVMNDPGTDSSRPLDMHPTLGRFTIDNVPEMHEEMPLLSTADMVSWLPVVHSDGSAMDVQEVRRPFGDTVKGMYRVLLVDPIRKPGPKSDFACLIVLGVEANGTLYKDTYWTLDLHLERLDEPALLEKIWDMGFKWRCDLIGIEALSVQHTIAERVKGDFGERFAQKGWMPRVFPITYKGALKDKGSRISGLSWRFAQFRMKVFRPQVPQTQWTEFEFQINNFTRDLRLLRFDDVVDTMAMIQFVLKPAAGWYAPKVDLAPRDQDMEDLKAGKKKNRDVGTPIVAAYNSDEIPREVRWANRLRRMKRHARRRSRGGQRHSTGA